MIKIGKPDRWCEAITAEHRQKRVSTLSVDTMDAGHSTDQTAVILTAFKQMRLDFSTLFTVMSNNDLAAAQKVLAALQPDQSPMANPDNHQAGTDSLGLRSPLAEQFPGSVLAALSLFACREKEPETPKLFTGIRASQRGVSQKQYQCTSCGNSVIVDRMLRPAELTCPVCAGRLAYRGCVK